MALVDLLIGALCAYRLTQLVVWDTISMPVVAWLSGKHRWFEELLSCTHCSGFWCAVLTAVVMQYQSRFLLLRLGLWAFALAGALSILEHATGWLESGDEDDPQTERDALLRRWDSLSDVQKRQVWSTASPELQMFLLRHNATPEERTDARE